MFSHIFELTQEVLLAHNLDFGRNRLQHAFELVKNNANLVQVLLFHNLANLYLININLIGQRADLGEIDR